MRMRMLTFLAVLGLGAFICLPGTAMGDTLYSQNFDAVGQAALISPGYGNTVSLRSVLPGWSTIVNNAAVTSCSIGNIYQAGSDGNWIARDGAFLPWLYRQEYQDFSLSIYNTRAGSVNNIAFTYTATGTVSNITGVFDYVSVFSLYTNVTEDSKRRTGGFENGLSYSINGGSAIALPGTSYQVVNNNIGGNWDEVEHMDSIGFTVRNILFSLTNVTLKPGDTVAFKWDQDVTAGDYEISEGIDNFNLSGKMGLSNAAQILSFFDTAISKGTLVGKGPGNSADGRLNALRNMLKSADGLIDAGNLAGGLPATFSRIQQD